ncbi:hypothetical protein ACET3X_009126 [Alternaria dauci]|uniref:Phosphoribosyltransferase domain-containing protein n=1 Tax=Alternaria dauci TaxID=48095 RepID=A0ABR3UAE1_9PLEO
MNDTTSTSSSGKPIKSTMIGLYGISGSGKSYLLKHLNEHETFANEHFILSDGSALVEQVVDGGLDAFKKMSAQEQNVAREQAISKAASDCLEANKVGVVAGHHMFWHPEKGGKRVGTKKDWETYTHIIYLNVDPEIIAKRVEEDEERKRRVLPLDHLKQWQHKELSELRSLCRQQNIAFTTLTESPSATGASTIERLAALLHNFRSNNETSNTTAVLDAVDAAIPHAENLETVLLLDADKTLGPFDTGLMFWEETDLPGGTTECPLTQIFKKQGYSHAAFRQATLLYEEKANEFEEICDRVAGKVDMYPDMLRLLNRIRHNPHVDALIVTCGLRRVWERVLQKNGLSNIKVIGGGRLADGYVVTGETKGIAVDHLHSKKLRVLAFGDSPLDMTMFEKADEAYVIVGDKTNRSSSMEKELTTAIENDRLSALQILLPSTVTPRLTLEKLPKAILNDEESESIFRSRRDPATRFHHATSKHSAKLLMTPTRDASIQSHNLRKAHERIGYYLTNEYVSSILGLEEVSIPHVQGNETSGHRFRHEKATIIIPLMRGGEPMAFGVSEAMPRAAFCHAKQFSDITNTDIFKGKRSVVLVDSVINSGKSLVDFITPLRDLCPRIRIVVVTGVAQADSVIIKPDKQDGSKADNAFAELLRDDRELYVVALRKSENKYKGKGQTDTGHRLFNTTQLD